MHMIRIGSLELGRDDRPFFIAGPCVIESEDHCLKLAESLASTAAGAGIDLVFKASYDKANRTSSASFRGPGLEEGLRILERVRTSSGLPVLSDVHECSQVEAASQVLDALQIPAFLCRQTDLIRAAARSGRAVNIKKGQFLSPQEMRKALEKALETGNRNIMLTERGTFFGYNNLVVDFRSLVVMRSFGTAVVFDATHSVQQPGADGDRSGGQAEFTPYLARAAAAIGADGFFFEVHDAPQSALSDGANAMPLENFPRMVDEILRIRAAAGRGA